MDCCQGETDSQNAGISLEPWSELGLPVHGLAITCRTCQHIPALERSVALGMGHAMVSRARNCCEAVLPAAAHRATAAAPTPPPGTQSRDEGCPGPTAGTSETVVLLFAICQAVKAAQKLPGSTWDLEPAHDCAPERLWQRPPPPGAQGWWAGQAHVVSPQNQTPPAPSTAPRPSPAAEG